MDKTVPMNKEVKEKKAEPVVVFMIFLLPIILMSLLYYFRKTYKRHPIIYIIFLILTIIYTLLDSLYVYMGILSHGFGF
jgi:hypothetical protein